MDLHSRSIKYAIKIKTKYLNPFELFVDWILAPSKTFGPFSAHFFFENIYVHRRSSGENTVKKKVKQNDTEMTSSAYFYYHHIVTKYSSVNYKKIYLAKN